MYKGRVWRYVYGWRDRITLAFKYTGQHTTGMVEDGYMGSGKKLTEVIKNLGQDEFHKRYEHVILQWCFDQDSLNQSEIYWIKKNKITIKQFTKPSHLKQWAVLYLHLQIWIM